MQVFLLFFVLGIVANSINRRNVSSILNNERDNKVNRTFCSYIAFYFAKVFVAFISSSIFKPAHLVNSVGIGSLDQLMLDHDYNSI